MILLNLFIHNFYYSQGPLKSEHLKGCLKRKHLKLTVSPSSNMYQAMGISNKELDVQRNLVIGPKFE